MQIEIKQLQTIEDMKLVQQLESAVWNVNPIPTHQTLTAVKNGGIILGAFFEGQILAFSYGFPGFQNGKAYLCSHMLGVHPDYRISGIGYKLKEKQRELALQMGFKLITWTFDPLESLNGHLNLSKLRGIVGQYIENQYGKVDDSLNYGLPTDRFLVEWWINSPHVEKKNQEIGDFLPAIKWSLNKNGFPILHDFESGDLIQQFLYEDVIYIPIPSSFQKLKQKDLEVAIDWRLKTRKAFQLLLNKDWTATRVIRDKQYPICYYQFVKKSTLEINEQIN